MALRSIQLWLCLSTHSDISMVCGHAVGTAVQHDGPHNVGRGEEGCVRGRGWTRVLVAV